MPTRTSFLLTTLASGMIALTATSGCVIAVDANDHNGSWRGNKVSKSEMREIVSSNREVRVGDSSAQVFGESALAQYSSTFSTETFKGHSVQEYRVLASTSDTRFERWYYFVDDELVAFSDDRVELSDVSLNRWID